VIASALSPKARICDDTGLYQCTGLSALLTCSHKEYVENFERRTVLTTTSYCLVIYVFAGRIRQITHANKL